NPGLSVSSGAAISAASLPVLPPSLTGFNVDNYKQPTSYQFSLGVQQQLGAKSVLGISYVGSQDRHESYRQEANLPNASLLPALTAVNGNGRDLDMNFLGYDGLNLSNNGAN